MAAAKTTKSALVKKTKNEKQPGSQSGSDINLFRLPVVS
jgi:hypothetical protein